MTCVVMVQVQVRAPGGQPAALLLSRHGHALPLTDVRSSLSVRWRARLWSNGSIVLRQSLSRRPVCLRLTGTRPPLTVAVALLYTVRPPLLALARSRLSDRPARVTMRRPRPVRRRPAYSTPPGHTAPSSSAPPPPFDSGWPARDRAMTSVCWLVSLKPSIRTVCNDSTGQHVDRRR